MTAESPVFRILLSQIRAVCGPRECSRTREEAFLASNFNSLGEHAHAMARRGRCAEYPLCDSEASLCPEGAHDPAAAEDIYVVQNTDCLSRERLAGACGNPVESVVPVTDDAGTEVAFTLHHWSAQSIHCLFRLRQQLASPGKRPPFIGNLQSWHTLGSLLVEPFEEDLAGHAMPSENCAECQAHVHSKMGVFCFKCGSRACSVRTSLWLWLRDWPQVTQVLWCVALRAVHQSVLSESSPRKVLPLSVSSRARAAATVSSVGHSCHLCILRRRSARR